MYPLAPTAFVRERHPLLPFGRPPCKRARASDTQAFFLGSGADGYSGVVHVQLSPPRPDPISSRRWLGSWRRVSCLTPSGRRHCNIETAVTATGRRAQQLALVGRCHRSCTCAIFRHRTSRDAWPWLDHSGECFPASALGDHVAHQATSRDRRRGRRRDRQSGAGEPLADRHLGIWMCSAFRRTNPSTDPFGCTLGRPSRPCHACRAAPRRAGSGQPIGIWQATRPPIF